MDKAIVVYLTFNSSEDARKSISLLLEKKLIACANMFQEHTSYYRWEGKLESNKEVSVILKTTRSHFNEINKLIKEHHNYDCPCILSLAVDEIHEPFHKWIVNEVDG